MKIGDIIKVKECGDITKFNWGCSCIFCMKNSSRVGVIINGSHKNIWEAIFDFGVWRINENMIKTCSVTLDD